MLFKTVTVLSERIIDYLVSGSHVRSKAVEGRLFKHNTSLFGERKTLGRDVFIHWSWADLRTLYRNCWDETESRHRYIRAGNQYSLRNTYFKLYPSYSNTQTDTLLSKERWSHFLSTAHVSKKRPYYTVIQNSSISFADLGKVVLKQLPNHTKLLGTYPGSVLFLFIFYI